MQFYNSILACLLISAVRGPDFLSTGYVNGPAEYIVTLFANLGANLPRRIAGLSAVCPRA